MTRKKVGLALSSGGARGFTHVGVIKVLEKHGIPIDCVAGTSIGAFVAAHYALHQDIRKLEDFALSFSKKRDILKYFDFRDPRKSLIKGQKVQALLKSTFGDSKFSDTKIPLRIGATALEDGSIVVFKSGKISRAVIASCSMPGIMPPMKYGNKHLVDGGLTNATPVKIVQQMKPDIIVAVDLFSLDKIKMPSLSTKHVLERTQEIMMANYSEKEYGKNIVVVKPVTNRRMQTFAFHTAKEKIKAGEDAANESVRKIKKLLS